MNVDRKKEERGSFMNDFLKIVSSQQDAKYRVSQEINNQDKKRGRFLKSQRVTLTEEMMKKGKSFRAGPGYYKVEENALVKPKTAKTSRNIKSVRSCAFVDQSRFAGTQTPGAKYILNEKWTIPNSMAHAKILPDVHSGKNSVTSRMSRIQVDRKSPAVGDYNINNAFKGTKEKREFKFAKTKLENFTDIIKKKKEFVPGSGHYKYNEKKAIM